MRTKSLRFASKELLATFALAVNVMTTPATAGPRTTLQTNAPIRWEQIGAKAQAEYRGDGLTLTPTQQGARLNCAFQRLTGEVVSDGLWLVSSVTNAPEDRFQVKAVTLGRARDFRAMRRGAAPKRCAGTQEVQMDSALQSEMSPLPGGFPLRSNTLSALGTVSVDGGVAKFVRDGVVEESSVSMDGVRQDFLVLEKPAPAVSSQLPTINSQSELRLELAVRGANVEATHFGARLILPNSRRRIAYSRLRVTDTNGKELPARIEVASGRAAHNLAATTLAILVNDTDAVYPIRIDPTFSDENWISMGGYLGANGNVYATVVDAAGNLYIGGDFDIVGNADANRIAKWDGSSWSALGSGINSYGGVSVLAVSGSDLYAGGRITSAGGVATRGIAKWNGTNWSALGSGMGGIAFPDVPSVEALIVSGSDLYAGGYFTTAGGVAATNIAKWNGANWSALGSGLSGGNYTTVAALVVWGSDLYAGGFFTTAGGVAATNIAKWNGSSWSALGSGTDDGVLALAISGTDLCIGGDFTTAGGVEANGIAKWDGSNWSALGSGMDAYGVVSVLAVSGSDLYAGGSFTSAGGVAATNIAKWKGTNWFALGSGMNSRVQALAISGNDLYVGGSFYGAGGVETRGIAKWDESSWSSLGSGMGFSVVQALAVSGSDLYAGGSFTTAGGVAANRIAKWNGFNWSPLGSGMGGDDNSSVSALITSGSDLFVGGYFTTAGGAAATNIAKWNGTNWSALGSGLSGGASYPLVDALVVSGSDLYAGGVFRTAGGVAATNIAKWNGSSWSALGLGINGLVVALAVSGNDLYAGGYFTTAGGVAAPNITKWNGTNWSALGSGMNSEVRALAISGSDLYAGGDFTAAGGVAAKRIAKWDGTNWLAIGSELERSVYSLAVSGNDVYVGGLFSTAGGVVADGIAKWDGSTWSALGSGVDGLVGALALSGSRIYVGGEFVHAGHIVSPYLVTALLPAGSPDIVIQPHNQNVMEGDPVTLEVRAGGAEPLNYQWFKNSDPLPESNSHLFTLLQAQTNGTGTYSVIVSNALGLSLSSNAVVTVLPWLSSTQLIRLNQTVTNDIAHIGERQRWNLFGRSGQSVIVAVETGGAFVPIPGISYAEVRLFDSAFNLLAKASRNVSGQPVILPNLTLPGDGVYQIQVTAPGNQPEVTGNYRLTVWDTTPSMSPLLLLLNQIHFGRIETPFSVDEWHFSAVAGQQVRFNFLNSSAPGITFALRGPSGWIGFNNLAGNSDFINLPANGDYTLNASDTLGAQDIAYAFRLEETLQTDLPLGTNFTGQFYGSGQARIFKMIVTNSNPIHVALQNVGAGNRAELYLKLGGPPTRGAFDFSSNSGPGANRDILIPSAIIGEYYVLVYGDYIPRPGSFTIQATSLGVALIDALPKSQADNVPIQMSIMGAGFEAGTSVELVGAATITATNASVDSYSQITASFPPSGGPVGTYSIRVSQPDGDTATLTNAFEMLAAGEPRLVTRVIMPNNLGRHAVATIYVEYANEGTASMPAPLLALKSSDPDDSDRPVLTLDQTRVTQAYWSAVLPAGTANEVFILASGAQPGVLDAGERRLVPVYYLYLQGPWDLTDKQVEMGIRYWTADDLSPIDWTARKDSLRPPTLDSNTWNVVFENLTSGLTNTGSYISMLSDNAQFLGRLGLTVTDVDELWNYEVMQAYGFSTLPVLDSAADSVVTAPGVALDLTRRFATNVRARNSTGWFGRGWYTPWQTRLTAESDGTLVKLVGEAGAARVFTRDARDSSYFSGKGDSGVLAAVGGVYELRDSNGTVTRFRADGRIDYVQDPHGNRVTTAWDGAGRLQTLAHTSGGWISLSYNGAGEVQGVTNSAGRSATYVYSGDYLLSITTDDGKVTSYTYETAGTLAQRHTLTSVTRGGTTRSFTFDTRGRMTSTFLAAGEQLVQFGYDSAGGVSVSDARGTTQRSFDHRGLLARVVDPLGHVTTAEFNNDLRLSRLVTPTGESQSFDWCGCGSPTRTTDELGHTTRFTYDNPFYRLTSFTDARSNTTHYTYDNTGNLLSTIYPNNSVERIGNYTASGLAQSHTNRRSQPISYTYTPAGQVSRQTFADGSYSDFAYNYRGSLTNVLEHAASGPEKITSYTYDHAASGDRLRKVTYPTARWVEFFYDGFGRRERMTDSTGQDLRYDFDAAGRLEWLRNATNAVLVEYLYDVTGRLSRVNKGNGTYSTYDYDAAGELLHLVNHAPGGAVNSRFDYTYDRRGRRIAMSTLDGDWTYSYDGSGQLTRAIFHSVTTNIPNQDLQYTYDPLGNRIHTVENGVTNLYAANNLNQYTSVGSTNFQYDADGSLTSDGVRTYQYDTQNRLVRVTGPEGVTEYEYDVQGNLTATVLNGQRTEYLLDPHGWADVVAEFRSSQLVAHYMHGLGLAHRWTASESNFYDFDGIGSVVSRPGIGGIADHRSAYEPFGRELVSVVSSDAFGFAGQYGLMTTSNQLVSARHRYMSPAFGRFVSEDPSRTGGGDVNLIRYAINNPVSLVDFNGLDSLEVGGFVADTLGLRPSALVGPTGISFCFAAGIGIGAGAGGGINTATPGPHGTYGVITEGDLGFVSGNVVYDNEGLSGGISQPFEPFPHFGLGGFAGPQVCSPAWCPWCSPPPPHGGPPGGGSPGGSGGTGDSGASSSVDPNEKFGAKGAGLKNWVQRNAVLPYRVNFENLGAGSVDGGGNPYPTFATAPAQQVTITDPLNTNLDWRTFQLMDIGFGDRIIAIPPGSQHFETTVTMTCCGDPFEAHIEAGINLASGQVYATFRSIDPTTSLPPPVNVGFLPPEDGTGRGQGHLSYLINAKTNLPDGTEIRNVALISFDNQPAIATDQIDPHNPAAGVDPNKQAFNTIDAGPPCSSVAALSAESGRAFLVQWSGQDDAGGSGIAGYDVMASTNGGPFGYWLNQTSLTSAVFHGEPGKTYAFYSIARDKVGFTEAVPGVPDAQTTVVSNAPQLALVNDIAVQPGNYLTVTNTVQGTVVGSFLFSIGPNSPGGVSVNPTNGILSWTPNCSQGNTTNVVSVWVTDSARTNVSDLVSFLVAVDKCVEPSLGQVVLLGGTSGKVPINLISKAALTNLQATLVSPPGRLLNFYIESIVSNICTTSVTQLTNRMQRLQLSTCSDGFLIGTQQVAWLHFTAADLASAFVSLSLTNLSGLESNGVPVANFAPQSGRVVVVSDEPLLECVRNTNGQPQILLYGKPAPGYSLESRTSVIASAWQTVLTNLIMTNLVRELLPPVSSSAVNLFRARREGSITPARLREPAAGGTNVVFLVRGLAYRAYNVQMATNLSGGTWQTIGSVTCGVDGVARFTNAVAPDSKERYYRTIVPE